MCLLRGFRATLIGIILILLPYHVGLAENKYITVASTTSTQNSGLFSAILPLFEKKTGIKVRIVAVGTGQALRIARQGDADVLFVHHKPSELQFVEQGFGVKRFEVMYNDFVIIGPKLDPAGIKGIKEVGLAFKTIAQLKNLFISRGDDSGTHKKELSIWAKLGFNPLKYSGDWYQEVGAGMGATLNITAAKRGYTLSDRGTWISFKNKQELAILLSGGPKLLNPYGLILINPEKHPHTKVYEGNKFIYWVMSQEGKNAINKYRVNNLQLFRAAP
tara:strand:- start:205 stop:1029 length:825 start_codon:yes stop_codon:yes gene_type:complete